MMSPDTWTARLSEYVDDGLDATERGALEAHLAGCADCVETVADLRRVKVRASALTDRPPAGDLWGGIAERIGVSPAPIARRRPGARRWTFTLPQLAAAGVALVVGGAGLFWAGRVGVVAVEPGPGAVDAPRVLPAHARETYDRAIADLERVLAENRAGLDTATIRILEESLRTIDRAIARAREALVGDPSDAYLNTHLAETMRRKLDLLRRAAALATASS
jgi:hypothetical protein